MKSLIRNIVIVISLVACSHAAPIPAGAWVMSVGSADDPPIIAILEKKNDQDMSIAFIFREKKRVVIPLKVSASPDNPAVLIVSGSVQFTEERRVQLLAFHGEFSEGTGWGQLVIVGKEAESFSMRNLKQLVAEADKAIKDAEQGGADQPATAPELKSEGKDKPQPEKEVAPR